MGPADQLDALEQAAYAEKKKLDLEDTKDMLAADLTGGKKVDSESTTTEEHIFDERRQHGLYSCPTF